MIRRLLIVLAAALVVLSQTTALAGPARAVKPPAGGATAFGYTIGAFGFSLQNPVEQQTDWPFPDDPAEWVINPFTDCYWDVDDNWSYTGYGSLAAGASVTLAQCFVSDADSHVKTVNGVTASYSTPLKFLGVYVTANSPDLAISVCYQPQDRCFTPGPVTDGKASTYRTCTQAHYLSGDPALVEVPGSQGGTGVVTTITLSVTNPTARKVDVSSQTGPSGRTTVVTTEACEGAVITPGYPLRYFVS